VRQWWVGWLAVAIFVLIAANPWTFRAFSTATGSALAIGLLASAARLAGRKLTSASLLIGLAIGSDARLSLPVLATASLAGFFLKIGFWKCMDEFVLPGFITGLFFLIPALTTRERPVAPSSDDRGTRELIRTLMRQPRDKPVVFVGASPSLEAGVFFYRRRYHLDWIHIRGIHEDNDFNIFVPAGKKAPSALAAGKISP
jgi:hypothetical protein